MKINVLDIETTDFFNKGGLIVEIALITYDLETGEADFILDEIIKEPGFKADLHKNSWIFNNSSLTPELVENRGVDIESVREKIQTQLDLHPTTAWNSAFDFQFLEDRKFKIWSKLTCPMKASTNYFKLPGRYGMFKWPKVEEAYRVLSQNPQYKELHRALQDTLDEAWIIRQLYNKNVIIIPGAKNEKRN